MKIDERAVGKLNPVRDRKEGTSRGGRRDDSCDHGLPRRPLRVKPPTSWARKWKVVLYIYIYITLYTLYLVPWYMFTSKYIECTVDLDCDSSYLRYCCRWKRYNIALRDLAGEQKRTKNFFFSEPVPRFKNGKWSKNEASQGPRTYLFALFFFFF